MDYCRIIWVICLLSIVQGKEIDTGRFNLKKLFRNDNKVFDVTDYKAVGDGITNDAQAFLDAWGEMCNTIENGVTLLVPDRTFLLSNVNFSGPCKLENPIVQVNGKIVAPKKGQWGGARTDRWIQFYNVNGLTINGSGQIDGQGSTWWDVPISDSKSQWSSALTLENCNGCQLSELTHVNSQRNHISISGCDNVVISNIHIIAPEDSPNTDGIDISLSQNIRIENSFIGTGDDCVAINGGCNRPIIGVTCGPGHGISIGSLGAQGRDETVEEVHVQNVNFTRTMNGARIKTWEGGKGLATKISFDQINLVEVYNPIVIDQHYFSGGAGEPSAVAIKDVTFSGIRGTSTNIIVINLNCSALIPCTNIAMDNINIQSTKAGASAYCVNAQGTESETSPNFPCLS
ncbi:hypothetical protein MKW94_010818 [Papaver nudicaule]|uniref:Polygalacturonase n=1 Tax=Papaver nudicaule TaxID=74823 RepID=A0AA41VK48_PAPNU|nr:hypothetical protein [Papaver nudicaule]